MIITKTYESGDVIDFRAPAGPEKFVTTFGTIESIDLHFDEENDVSTTVFAVSVNDVLYNISRIQIMGIHTVETHQHSFRTMCIECGQDANDDV
jgi:hypothetical protein